MSLAISGDTIAYLMGLGLSGDQMKGLIDRLQKDALELSPKLPASNEERERIRNESTYAERKRAKDRERRARERDELRALKAEREATATTRDSTSEATATEGDQPATVSDPAPHTCAQVVNPTSSLRSEAYPPVKPNGLTAPKGAETARGTRLPESWSPDEAGWRYAAEILGPDVDPSREFDRFRDYWRAVPGAKGRKTDWPATWRNWCRNAAERLPKPRQAHDRPDPHNAKLAAKQANYAAAERGADIAARFRGQP